MHRSRFEASTPRVQVCFRAQRLLSSVAGDSVTTLSTSPVQSSKLLLALASTVNLGFGTDLIEKPLPTVLLWRASPLPSNTCLFSRCLATDLVLMSQYNLITSNDDVTTPLHENDASSKDV
jgi:hypothetical protein